jgi:TolB protein
VHVVPLDDLDAVRVLSASEQGTWSHERPVWSPDGRTICFNDQNDLWLVDADGGPPRRLETGGDADVQAAWSPGGRFLYFSSIRDGIRAIWRQSLAGGPATRVTMGPEEKRPSLSRDGRRLAYATHSQQTRLVLVDTSSGRREEFLQTPFVGLPAVAPDGSEMVFVSDRDRGVDLWRLAFPGGEPAREPQRLTELPGSVSWPTFSRDGRWIAFHRVVDGQRDIWTIPATGGASRQVTRHVAVDVSPRWSPDDSRLAFVSDRSGTDQVWAVSLRRGRRVGEARPLTDGALPVDCFAWSPDGRGLACVSPVDGVNEIWLMTIGQRETARRLTEGAGVVDLRWPPGRGLIVALALWGGSVATLRTVDPATGETAPLSPGTAAEPSRVIPDFDVSPDGRWLALVEVERRGDVWLLEASDGSF